jgi:hypothetical protein
MNIEGSIKKNLCVCVEIIQRWLVECVIGGFTMGICIKNEELSSFLIDFDEIIHQILLNKEFSTAIHKVNL